MRGSSRLIPLVLPLAALAAWGLASALSLAPAWILPPPGHVLHTLSGYVLGTPGSDPYAGRFWADLGASLTRVGAGFGLAVALGLPLGVASGRVRPVALLLSPLVNGLKAVPGISWLPLALVWLGVGFQTTVFLVAMAAFFPIYLSAAAGSSSVPQVLLRAGAMLGLSGPGLVARVIVPASMVHIVSGLRLGLGVSFAYLVLGELTGASKGLGAMIMDARMLGRVDLVMVGIGLVALVGWLSDAALVVLMRLAFRSARHG